MAMQVARAKAGVSANALTESGALDPLSGNAALSGVQVEVVAASGWCASHFANPCPSPRA
jgi:hypothetical protein